MATRPTAQQDNAAQPVLPEPTALPEPNAAAPRSSTPGEQLAEPQPAEPQAAPSNRAERRRKNKGIDPAAAAAGHHGTAGQPGVARTTAQGRRINPVRRTG